MQYEYKIFFMLQHALSKICLYDADTQHCVMRELKMRTVEKFLHQRYPTAVWNKSIA